MSTRHPLTTGATGHAGRPFLSSHDRSAGSRRYRPRSVPTHTRPPESAASARTRFAHSAPGDEGGQRVGVGNSVHVRPPSLDRKSTRLNSSHLVISYAVFCLKKKNTKLIESPCNLVCRLLLEKKNKVSTSTIPSSTTCPVPSLSMPSPYPPSATAMCTPHMRI